MISTEKTLFAWRDDPLCSSVVEVEEETPLRIRDSSVVLLGLKKGEEGTFCGHHG